jgi:thiol-disulfide isomerase/thioredoxin
MHNILKSFSLLIALLVLASFSTPAPAPEVGQVAPDIALTSPDGKVIKLSSLRGKVVLIDFWASWCGPCRKENPYTVEIYEAYKAKGFTVYSVSLDQNKMAWQKAIQKDGLPWESHVSDLKGWRNKAAADYGVEAIPATFLIDRNGTIVAKDVHGGELDKAVRKALKK